MYKMIDIHNHIIPKFDDGPKSFDESLDLLRMAQEQGISTVFATSHFNEYIPKELENEYFEKLEQLKEKAYAQNIRIDIHSGSEIFYHHYVQDTVKNSRVTTLGGWGQYVLIEFPMFQMPEGVEEVLFRLSAENFIPVVAHPERYSAVVERWERTVNFIKYGALLQVNGGSILGIFGKEIQKVSMTLLEQNLVHFIASDAHSPNGRKFVMGEVREFLKDKIPSAYLKELLSENQQKVIDKTPLENASVPEENGRTGFFSRLKKSIKQTF